MQPYATTTVVIYVIGFLALVLMIVYFYNQYKAVKEQEKANTKDRYMAPCPDYWENVGENKCRNVFKLGNCALGDNTVMDFSDKVFQDVSTGGYAKCKWAKGCNVYWGNVDRLC